MFKLVDTMVIGIGLLGDSLDEGATQALEDLEAEILAYAQSNAPWNDRTGEARMGLVTDVVNEGDEVTLYLAHTAEHGQWLETIQNGRFAIIMPTLETFAPIIFQETGARFKGMYGS